MISIRNFSFSLFLILPIKGQDLRITEVMTDSVNGGDWFELTNFTNDSINLYGYTWSDQSELDDHVPLPQILIDGGESIIVLIGLSAEEFRIWWDLEKTIKIIDYSHEADLVLPRFSSLGDQVKLYAPSGELLNTFETETSYEGLSHSRLRDGTVVPLEDIRDGQNSYRKSVGSGRVNRRTAHDYASPGEVGDSAQFPPIFTQRRYEHEWQPGKNLETSGFRIHAHDPNPDDWITFSHDGLPDWLTLVNDGARSARLIGTPPADATGLHFFTLTATDNHGNPSPDFLSSSLALDIIPLWSPLILNEYNAVSSTEFLGGGEENDQDGAYDTRLGRVRGNGGFWVEFVIVGTNNSLSPVDLRGWRFQFEAGGRSIYFTLRDNPALSAIPVGTILTFTTDPGTSPSRIHVPDKALSEGYFWTNISLHDQALVEDLRYYSYQNLEPIWNQQFAVTVSSPSPNNSIITGPSGERSARQDQDNDGIYETSIKVGSDEVFKLEDDPFSGTSPITANYDDGKTSTFGEPNIWNNRKSAQSFSRYIPSNLPPVIEGSPSKFCASSTYLESFSVHDPEDKSITVDLVVSPDFLSISRPTPGSIQLNLNRTILETDIGDHLVTIAANDGSTTHHTGYFTYILTVANPTPSVILNEINTVSKFGFLNGGDELSDSNGEPLAEDQSLGRLKGNGGDWFELVVVGDGTASVVDIRDWRIEIGRMGAAGQFEMTSYLRLNQHSDLSDVPAGTILLFYESIHPGESDPRFVEPNSDSLYTQGWQTIHFPISLNSGRSRYLHSYRSNYRAAQMDLDANDTLIRILDPEARVVFGPVGEGIVPGVKVGNDEIFELEAHPSPQIGILSSREGPNKPGYDDSDSESTFGLPNRFRNGDGALITQDFSPFILERSSYQEWAEEHDLTLFQPHEDQDRDGHDNMSEYLAGSSPVSSLSMPSPPSFDWNSASVTIDVRVNDPAITYQSEYSHDLLNWWSYALIVSEASSPLGISFRRRTLRFDLYWEFHFDYYLIFGPPRELFFRNIPVIENR